MPETIDLTPTWRGTMQIIIAALENGTETGRKLARAELMDLAGKLDASKFAMAEPKAAKGRTFWIAAHQHRHGDSMWPVWQDQEPTRESIIESLGDDFEPDRDESVAFDGPYTVPND